MAAGTNGSTRRTQFVEDDSLAYLSANDGVDGFELWKSNGTAAGTVLVKDISSGSANSHPGGFTSVDGRLFFIANDGTSGYELWKSKRAAAGTLRVTITRTGATAGSTTM